MDARTVVRWLAAPVALFVGGAIVLGAAGGAPVANVFAILLLGGGGLWLVSLGFYAVGRSEDREREQHEAASRPPEPPPRRRRPPAPPRRRDHSSR